ncbi:MAG: sodium:solute symporter family protein [bacterium]
MGEDIFVSGLVVMAVIYVLLFLLAWLGPRIRKRRETGMALDSTDLFLAGRSLPLWMAIFTMTATWVGGGYLAGTAEAVFDIERGQGWAQAGWGYALSLVLGGLFYAKKMREMNYTTMLDPFEQKYGWNQTVFLYLFALLGEILWTGAAMAAMGAAFSTILGISMSASIIITAAITIAYTVLSGMWAVAYTDVLQLCMVIVFLTLAVITGMIAVGGWDHMWANYNQAFGDKGSGFIVGYFAPLKDFVSPEIKKWPWTWMDYGLLYIFGGIPWHCYFQRVLGSKSGNVARYMSIGAGVAAFILVIPPTLLAIIGYNYDWVANGIDPPANPALILPYVLRYCVPAAIGALGLGAVAAAVMSSVDSSILSASSMFTWNIFKRTKKKPATDAQLKRVLRTTIIVAGTAATIIALRVKSVYALWYLNCDLVYITLFPALTAALFYKKSNRFGIYAGIAVALILRALGGLPEFELDPIFNYWMWVEDPETGNITTLFPFRTFAMVCGLMTIISVSKFTQKWDPAKPLQKFDLAKNRNSN